MLQHCTSINGFQRKMYWEYLVPYGVWIAVASNRLNKKSTTGRGKEEEAALLSLKRAYLWKISCYYGHEPGYTIVFTFWTSSPLGRIYFPTPVLPRYEIHNCRIAKSLTCENFGQKYESTILHSTWHFALNLNTKLEWSGTITLNIYKDFLHPKAA